MTVLGISSLLALLAAAAQAEPAPRPVASDTIGPPTFAAGDPGAVSSLMEELGYEVEEEVEDDPPALFTEHDGLTFEVWFYACDGGTRCREIIVVSTFETGGDLSLRRINEWNRDAYMGRAYLDDRDDAVLEHHVVVEGGLTRANFEAMLGVWTYTLKAFADHVFR